MTNALRIALTATVGFTVAAVTPSAQPVQALPMNSIAERYTKLVLVLGRHDVDQVNTDLPVYIDRAVDLACHEGYPGHHVYNALLEKHLVRDRGWVEFSIYPLFSPQSRGTR